MKFGPILIFEKIFGPALIPLIGQIFDNITVSKFVNVADIKTGPNLILEQVQYLV